MHQSKNRGSMFLTPHEAELESELRIDGLPNRIDRRNLLPTASRVLPFLLGRLPPPSFSGPTRIKDLWPRWWDIREQRIAAERRRRKLYAIIKQIGAWDDPVAIRDAYYPAEKCASRYNQALTDVAGLRRHESIAGRTLMALQPYYVEEICAKLHCMIVMHDPELKSQSSPWPEIRAMLKELIRPTHFGFEPRGHIRRIKPCVPKPVDE